MMSDREPAGKKVLASHPNTSAGHMFRRVLLPIADASQAARAAELARGAGATEARVLHLSLHENISGKRYPIESDSAASYVIEAGVFELRMAGIPASGQVRNTLVGRVAQEIVADADAWDADLIVLGVPRRGKLLARLFGSVTLRVLKHASCPVLVPSAAADATTTEVATGQYAGTRS